MTKVYINGKLFDKADAKISVYDHGLLYGDGVFEGIRVYDGKVFRLHEHIDRLYDSARAHRTSKSRCRREQMTEAVQRHGPGQQQEGRLHPPGRHARRRHAWASTRARRPIRRSSSSSTTSAMYPPELYENGMEIVTAATIRNHPNALNPRIKSLNYLNNILAKIEAIRAGCLEALMLNHKGEVAECTGDNIFLVKHGVLQDAADRRRHPRRRHAQRRHRAGRGRRASPCRKCTLTRHDVYTADECFLTGTAAEVIPVVKCDGRVIGTGKPGPITRQLRERFHQAVRQEKGGR